ncbi:MAG: hypothetical protein AAGB04_00665 [Pseudomonadota bacterium]
MTYARARLWLGITGVGTMVIVACFLVITRRHETIFSTAEVWRDNDVWSLGAFIGAFMLIMLPLDLLGGFVLPNSHHRQSTTFAEFFGPWLIGVMLQSFLFLSTGLSILAIGRLFGLGGVLTLLATLCVAYVAMQGNLVRLTIDGAQSRPARHLAMLRRKLQQFRVVTRPVEVLSHNDPGFTGGVVGLPGRETIIIPRSWFNHLSTEQLAIAVTRRLIAIESNSRSKGLLLALLWILTGFTLSTLLPGAGVKSVAQLVTTCAGFTLWTFFGLLVLPSVSRLASYSIDRKLVERGVSPQLLESTLTALDRLQDDEPERSKLIETIFHPVPSVANRREPSYADGGGAWHAARMVLFLSWSCLGLLSRAVHCNAGRPELWIMLPTD